MKKMKTLFKRVIENHVILDVLPEVAPGCEWVFTEKCKATRKLDGTACAIIKGRLYTRLDLKNSKTKTLPEGAIPCQEYPDEITGSFPHWIPATKEGYTVLSDDLTAECRISNSVKYAVNAFIKLVKNSSPTELTGLDGTYELCGPHLQGNPEGYEEDTLVKHGSIELDLEDFSFEGIKQYLATHKIEGIVFHRSNGEMTKIKRSDFGYEWKEDARKALKSKRN